MKRAITILILLWAQVSGQAQTRFTEEEFLSVVRQFHPVARQAGLGVRIARAGLLASRGAFDPSVKLQQNDKIFDGTNYYDVQGGELKIPTWYGIDLYAGMEQQLGDRLNPEETRGRMSYVGIGLPVQHLLMDKRRAALQQAKLFVRESEAVQLAQVNELLGEALTDYWTWWEQYQLYRLVDSSLTNALQRLNLVRTSVRLGERAAIDTVEALTQVQSFTLQKADAFTRLQKARFSLSVHLWKEDGEAYLLPEKVVPQEPSPVTAPTLDELLTASATHPELQQYNFQLSALQVERRLKFFNLFPDLDLKYQQLGKGYSLGKPVSNPWFQNNYRFGVSLSVPLRLSQGRGEYQAARLKIEQTGLKQDYKRAQIGAKLRQFYVEWQQTTEQVNVQDRLVANYLVLQRGEETKFFNGESSLFLINTREQKTLESKQKLIELKAKNRRALAGLQVAAGVLR